MTKPAVRNTKIASLSIDAFSTTLLTCTALACFFSAKPVKFILQNALSNVLISVFNTTITLPNSGEMITLPAIQTQATIQGSSLVAILAEFLAVGMNTSNTSSSANQTFYLPITIPAGTQIPNPISSPSFTLLKAFGDTALNFIDGASSGAGTFAMAFLITCGALLTLILLKTLADKLFVCSKTMELKDSIDEMTERGSQFRV